MNSLDVLADVINFVLSLVRSHPCSCQRDEQGEVYRRCQRCELLRGR